MKNKKKRERTKSPIPHHFEFFYFFLVTAGMIGSLDIDNHTPHIRLCMPSHINAITVPTHTNKKNKKGTPLNGECEPNPASTSSNPHHHTSTNSPHKPHCQRCHRVRHLGMWRTHPRTLASYQSANSP